MNNLSKENEHLPPAVIEKFLVNQEKEITLRSQEIELRKQADSNNFEYAKAALEAQSKDREASRNAAIKNQRHRFIFIFLLVLVLGVFLSLALLMNKDSIAMEIIRAILYLSAGGIGGYAYAKNSINLDKDKI